jgi:hypothetical protein
MENSSDLLTVASIRPIATKEGITQFGVSFKNDTPKNMFILISDSEIIHGNIQDRLYSVFSDESTSYYTDPKNENIIHRWKENTLILKPGQSYDDYIAPISYCTQEYGGYNEARFEAIGHKFMKEPIKILIKYKIEDEEETHTLFVSYSRKEK